MASFSFLDEMTSQSEEDLQAPASNSRVVKADYLPGTNLLGDSPTEDEIHPHTGASVRVPLPQNRTVLALKDESRREAKELRRSPTP